MTKKRFYYILFAFAFLVFASLLHCTKSDEANKTVLPLETAEISAQIETQPVDAGKDDDAADDPAIWINFEDPSKSLIIGTNKKAGLNLYDLEGNELFFIPEGRINNVDLRYNFDLNGEMIDITAGSNRSDNTLSLHRIQGESAKLIPVHARKIESDVNEVYGICMYHSPVTGDFYAFLNGKDGMIEQWRLFATENNLIDAELVRTLEVDSQPEGMVADDETGMLYVGEEEHGVWRFNAEPDQVAEKIFIEGTGVANEEIDFDIEGVSIFYLPDGEGYLLVSSQGNNTFAVYNRKAPHEYITSFEITDGIVDGVEETDGIDVSNYGFNDSFPGGILIVQDGFNFDGDSLLSQNFKYVDWRKVAYFIDPDMEIDPEYSPYLK